jgi:hypothetical protein
MLQLGCICPRGVVCIFAVPCSAVSMRELRHSTRRMYLPTAFDASATNAWRTSYAGQAATANGGGRQRPHQLLKFTDCACVAEAFSIHSRRF